METKKIPKAPKKPLTIFFRYKKENWEFFRTKYPKEKTTDLMKLISSSYRKIEVKEKSRYEKEYKKEHGVWKEKNDKYKKKYKNELKILKRKKYEEKKIREEKKKNKEILKNKKKKKIKKNTKFIQPSSDEESDSDTLENYINENKLSKKLPKQIAKKSTSGSF